MGCNRERTCSFDGHEFKTFHSDHYRDHNILNLAIDDHDKVWHFNLSGDLFVTNNSRVIPVHGYKYDDYPINEIAIYESLVFLMHNVNGVAKLSVYDVDGTNLRLRKELLNDPANGNASFSLRGDQFLFFEYSEGTSLYSLNLKSLEKTLFHRLSMRIRLISLVDNNNVFLTTLDSIFLLNNKKEMSSIAVSDKSNSITEAQGEYYSLSDKGLSYLIINDNKLVGLEPKLPEFQILRACEDSEGCSWLGTKNQGILFIPSAQSMRYSNENSELSSNFVRTLSKDKNIIYAGLNDGKIAQINSGELQMIEEDFGKEVNKILFFKQNMIVGSNHKLIFKNLISNKRLQLSQTIKDLSISSDSVLNIGTSSSYEKATFLNPDKSLEFKKLRISNSRTYAVNRDNQGHFWEGSVNGLIVHNLINSEIDTILEHNISDIIIKDDSTAYVSTFAQGMWLPVFSGPLDLIWSISNSSKPSTWVRKVQCCWKTMPPCLSVNLISKNS